MGEKGVGDRTAGDAECGGCLEGLEAFLVVETDDRQPFPQITEEQHRFAAADAFPAGPAGQRDIDFGQTVSPAAGFVLPEAEKEINAGLVELVMRVAIDGASVPWQRGEDLQLAYPFGLCVAIVRREKIRPSSPTSSSRSDS